MLIKSYIAYTTDGNVEELHESDTFEVTDVAPIEITLQVLQTKIETTIPDHEEYIILFALDEEKDETLH